MKEGKGDGWKMDGWMDGWMRGTNKWMGVGGTKSRCPRDTPESRTEGPGAWIGAVFTPSQPPSPPPAPHRCTHTCASGCQRAWSGGRPQGWGWRRPSRNCGAQIMGMGSGAASWSRPSRGCPSFHPSTPPLVTCPPYPPGTPHPSIRSSPFICSSSSIHPPFISPSLSYAHPSTHAPQPHPSPYVHIHTHLLATINPSTAHAPTARSA